MSKKSSTVGRQALELMQKEPEVTTVIDQQRAMQEKYIEELLICVSNFRKIHHGDFFVSVLTKSEKLLPNVFRNYFVARISCPTPNYDQSVYRYKHQEEEVEFIWTIPCKGACFYLKENAHLISKEEHDLLKYVIAFADGTLYQLCKHLNNEYAEESPSA